ncbi:MAG: hypothetical protein F2763_04570 [Actinobacteria bacterium]|uniref:Unannotated protein n=1 Tax=freshwater metagenome TaxID=449393 RepID=A0A6J7ADD2_9ZZZZ|nr:hypothetical protein [Actinomycetota bacterium]
MTSPPHEPSPEQNDPEQDSAWEAIVADLSGDMRMEIGDLNRQIAPEEPDPFIEELLSEGRFEPPEPPPIPLPDTIGRFAWAGAIGGPIFLVLIYVLGLGSFLTTLALVASIAGFITLVARKREREVSDGERDDGAVV